MFNRAFLPPLLLTAALLAGCGSSSTSNPPVAGAPPASGSAAGQESGTVLAADAKTAHTGDIPDTQNYLTLNAPKVRVSMLYPEGWTVQETGSSVSITEKNNQVRISVANGAAPTVASVTAQLAALRQTSPSLVPSTPHPVTLKSGSAVKVTYTTQSAPNPVTGKQVTLNVDRYVIPHAGRVAIVDLGVPVGVDNIDAYRKMIESFRWL